MADLIRILSNKTFTCAKICKMPTRAEVKSRRSLKLWLTASAAVVTFAGSAAADDSVVTKAPAIPFTGPAYNWNGFYAGGHIGGAFGTSNWSTPGASGSAPIYQTINTFDEAGSFIAGIQGG